MRIGRLANGRTYRVMRIVLNTSPIIFLGKINRLNLLEHCASHIVTPKNVVLELGDYELPDFIHVESLSMVGLAEYYRINATARYVFVTKNYSGN